MLQIHFGMYWTKKSALNKYIKLGFSPLYDGMFHQISKMEVWQLAGD